MFIETISAFVTDMTYTHCTVNTSYAYARSGIAFSDYSNEMNRRLRTLLLQRSIRKKS